MPEPAASTAAIPTPPPPQRSWLRIAGLLLGAIAFLYAMVIADLALRARHAYLEGEKYVRWNGHPAEKKTALETEFQKNKKPLDRALAKNEISKEEYDRKLEALTFDLEFRLGESSLKYAYAWYKTAYELFTPPETPWSRHARAKAPHILEEWKKELRAKGVPFEDYMLE